MYAQNESPVPLNDSTKLKVDTVNNKTKTFWRIHEICIEGIKDTKQEKKIRRSVKGVRDSIGMLIEQQRWETYMKQRGWQEFSLDRWTFHEDTLFLWFHEGAFYQYDQIELGNVNPLYEQKAGIERLETKKMPLDWEDIKRRMAFMLNQYQNNGYPFAAFDSLTIAYQKTGQDSIGVALDWEFEEGEFIRMDSIRIEGHKREKDAFVYSLIRLYPDAPYNQELIDDIQRVLNNSIYYTKVKPPEVIFTPYKQAKLIVKLEKRRSSKFDVLLGLLPPKDQSQKLQFTGLLDLTFISPFKFGESLHVKYEKLTATSQRIQFSFAKPYLFRTPFKAEAQFFLHKQEESFLNRHFTVAGHYAFSTQLSAKFYYRNKGSSLLDATPYENSTEIPPVLDGTHNMYGVGVNFNNLDFRFNPTKGVSISLEGAFGRRTIRRNPLLSEDIYAEVGDNQAVREVESRIDWYQKVFKRQVLYLGNHTYWLGQNRYFENDQLQVGGSRNLRGFNENEFYTDLYSRFTLEYRLLLERNSYVFIFGDYAYLQNSLGETPLVSHPIGIGLGMNYETAAGIISISYAIGRVGEQSFQPGRGKVHIGLINQF